MRALQGLGTQDLEGLASSWRIGQGDSEAGHRLYVRRPRCLRFLRTGDAHDVKQDGAGMDHVRRRLRAWRMRCMSSYRASSCLVRLTIPPAGHTMNV